MNSNERYEIAISEISDMIYQIISEDIDISESELIEDINNILNECEIYDIDLVFENVFNELDSIDETLIENTNLKRIWSAVVKTNKFKVSPLRDAVTKSSNKLMIKKKNPLQNLINSIKKYK